MNKKMIERNDNIPQHAMLTIASTGEGEPHGENEPTRNAPSIQTPRHHLDSRGTGPGRVSQATGGHFDDVDLVAELEDNLLNHLVRREDVDAHA